MPIPSGLDEDTLYELGYKQTPSDRWWVPDYQYESGIARFVEPPDFEDRLEVEPNPERFETDPQEFVAQQVGYGQRYRDYPLADRFGQWPEDERQEGIRRLLEEFQNQYRPPAGFDVVDPLGHRGVRSPGGFYMLKGI